MFNFVQTVEQFIRQQQLLSLNDKVVVALSGGSDSVALLQVLLKLRYQCVAVHCNFCLRGNESERDESFVRELCHNLNVSIQVVRFNTREYASEHHLSIEMAARELRYNYFEQYRQQTGASVIAVAHHRDDSIETVLLNMIRGTGIHGLGGIRPKNGYIVRPLLNVSRLQILEYLKDKNQSFVTDSTNLEDAFTRNKIRLRLLPLMKQINPSIEQSLQTTAFYLNEASKLYDVEISNGKQRVLSKNNISIDALKQEPSPYALLFEILHPYGFNSKIIAEIYNSFDSQSGKEFFSNTNRVVKDRNNLIIQQISDKENEIPPFNLAYNECELTDNFVIPKSTNKACLDADKIMQPLQLRKWRRGDKFVPFGMKGQKLVSDFMTDLKLSVIQKEQQWVLSSGDNIIWVVGLRIDNRFRIGPQTKKVLLIEKV